MIQSIICGALWGFFILVILRIVFSWFPASSGGGLEVATGILFTLTEWALGPVRKLLPPVRMGGMGLDLSPIVIILLVQVLIAVTCS